LPEEGSEGLLQCCVGRNRRRHRSDILGSQWILAYVGRRHIGSTYEEDIEVLHVSSFSVVAFPLCSRGELAVQLDGRSILARTPSTDDTRLDERIDKRKPRDLNKSTKICEAKQSRSSHYKSRQEVLVPHLLQMDARFDKANEKELTKEMPRNLTIESQRDDTRRCGTIKKICQEKHLEVPPIVSEEGIEVLHVCPLWLLQCER